MDASVIRSVGWLKGPEEEDGRCRNKLRPNPPWRWDDEAYGFKGQGRSREQLTHTGDLWEHAEKVVLDEAPLPSKEGTAFVALLRTCTGNKDLDSDTKVHDDIVEMGLLKSCSNALITMYAKCGALAKARKLLEIYKCTSLSSWNALIAGYAHQGQGWNALQCFERMQKDGFSPNAKTFACILKACGSIKDVDKGKQIHDEIIRQGLLRNDIVLGNALIDMYVKCSALGKAKGVLEELPARDVVSWNSLLTGYAQEGHGQQALDCYEQMQHERISPDAVTFICVLKACGSLKAADKGQKIHDEITQRGLWEDDVMLGTALVDMYAKCGFLAKAHQVLDRLSARNVVSWNALISGYAHQNQGQQALQCFERMQCESLSPNSVTYTCVLKACGSLRAVDKGEQIHEKIARQGLLTNNIVLGTALVDMYAKCGALEKAQQVLNDLPSRDVIAWNALIAGYAQKGLGEQALNCLEWMQAEGFYPNTLTFTSILKACGIIGAAGKGEEFHHKIFRQGLLENDIGLGSALVDMYAKSGALAKAQQALEGLPFQDVVSWNALVAGYAHQGQSQHVLSCLERMEQKGLSPNAVTLSCVLNVCSHLGLIAEGNTHFMIMRTKYGMQPNLEHYTCMVDLFGRAGHVGEAVEVIQEMPSFEYPAVWAALLGACRKWGDVQVGRWAYEQAIQVEKSDGAAYVLVADICAAAGYEEIMEDMTVEYEARLRSMYCYD